MHRTPPKRKCVDHPQRLAPEQLSFYSKSDQEPIRSANRLSEKTNNLWTKQSRVHESAHAVGHDPGSRITSSSYISPEQASAQRSSVRPIRTMVDEILKQLSPQFGRMYAKVAARRYPPEQLFARAQLLQMLYSGATR